MRSQATKPVVKKGASNKTSFKTKTVKKRTKKKVVSPKKVKALTKSVKNQKNVKDDGADNKEDDEKLNRETPSTSVENPKITPKSISLKQEALSKKVKKESKGTISPTKPGTKKTLTKKSVATVKKAKPNPKTKKIQKDSTNLDNKRLELAKKSSKSKGSPKKGNSSKAKNSENVDDVVKQNESNDINKTGEKAEKSNVDNLQDKEDTEMASQIDPNGKTDVKEEKCEISSPKSTSIILSPKSSKNDTDRPPKFFTSTRSPRTLDIDVKCCKNSKGNLTVSERFLPLKCETKTEDIKEKTSSNAFVAQGPDIDVYTFTEKVDSPKSILSDFRNPINKTVGRVRPIARVKGTVIDKKNDTDKKKYSPHRPIEEVVKQLKASKKSDDVSGNQQQTDTTNLNDSNNIRNEPKQLVSKSYKMVARKSSVSGKPFSPINFLDQETDSSKTNTEQKVNKKQTKSKKQQKKNVISDEEIESSTFALNSKTPSYSSSEESVSESNDDQDFKVSSDSDSPKNKKSKNKKYKRITDSLKKSTSKELKELSKDSLVDLKDTSVLGNEKPSKRRLKLLSMWSGPKRHRMASLNALAKVHCLYENESRSHVELGLMKTVERQPVAGSSKATITKKEKKEVKTKESEKQESTSEYETEYETKKEKDKDSSDSSDDSPPQRSLRGVPGIRSAGKYWDPKSSTSSSEDSEIDCKGKINVERKKTSTKTSTSKSDCEKPSPKMKKTAGVPIKKKRNRNEVVMDLKDMVVQKRMASLNATAILAASYEKRSPKSSKDDSTSDSCSDESFSQKPKNVIDSGVKSEVKNEEPKKEIEDCPLSDRKQKVEVIVNQDTDVTITGVYSTHHHEGFCTVSGMQYRISSTSHTQTTATANCEKEGCSREDGARYTPLSALSSMQPPAEHSHPHPQPVPELGGLSRRPGCSSAFSAPSPAAHHDPGKTNGNCSYCEPPYPYGYYQPAGPLIKETSAEAERALTRYHPPPHYHAPHPPVLPQYGPYYPTDLCYGRYYRPPGPYHMAPSQPESPMVGVGSEPYPPQYYGTPPCYQHSPQRIPYVEYRGCPCPLNACPKNVLIGPATGKAPAGGGPVDVPPLAPPGAAFRPKVRAGALDSAADTHGSGKDPPLEPEPPEPPTAADAPHPCPLPAMGGASPKRELYDVRDGLRLNGDLPGPEALGPPSPARGSAGICAPQPPPVAPRRARLGKEMARRSLAGDDTTLLLSTPQPPSSQQEMDDDVLAISPPISAPIDLSSSDERSTPVVDVKKENEGPTFASSRKTDAPALREHNCTTGILDGTSVTESSKPVKRRHSRTKLEIEMKDVQLEDVCKTNGIGEHVKLQKRRKVSGDQSDPPRIEAVTKEFKKKYAQHKKTPKTPSEKKSSKRKSESTGSEPKAKKMLLESEIHDPRLQNVAALNEKSLQDDNICVSQKTKSAEVLDNLLKKNSLDRSDIKGYITEKELNPASLFLPSQNTQNSTKKTLNINNNVVDNSTTISGVTPETIAAVSQLIEKKLANKNACKLDSIDSKITHNLKSVLHTSNDTFLNYKDDKKSKVLGGVDNGKYKVDSISINKDCYGHLKVKSENLPTSKIKNETLTKTLKALKSQKCKISGAKSESEKNALICDSSCESQNIKAEALGLKTHTLTSDGPVSENKTLDTIVSNSIDASEDLKRKTVEKVVKLLVSKRQAKLDEAEAELDKKAEAEKAKRCKLSGEKGKSVEKVAKLLVSKKTVIKTDEAALVIEDACSSPVPGARRRAGRRRSGARRVRRLPAPLAPPEMKPRPPPRWSNGWNWEGDYTLSKVYLNNDSRLDRTARCWQRMKHASGDAVARGDCVLLRASTARAQPFVARVASLWENPDDGEMMVSLVWYYRPEHTERGRQAADAPDEVFASRHRDANSVACIEDKCYVLTFNEYCRYRKRLKAAEEGLTIAPSIVPPFPASEVTAAIAPTDTKLPPAVSPELVLFCRKVYDFRTKKIHVPNK